jgi:serine/threonine protein kinase
MFDAFKVRKGSVGSKQNLERSNLNVNNYLFYSWIGQGSYCTVRVVKSRSESKYYALKYISKSQPAHRIKTIVRERNVLSSLNHSYLCNLMYAFQDDEHLYMILDLQEGGDFRYYLRTRTLSEKAIRRVIAELSYAIGYIHDQSIVHRDIKPENILIDANGHAHLGDFNVATRLSPERPAIIGVSGTFNYLAPEMHEKIPYTEQVDWWALGVIFYESVYGRLPFKGKTTKEMIQQMVNGPSYMHCGNSRKEISTVCVDAIKSFLVVSPQLRVKSQFDVFRLKFFQGLNVSILDDSFTEPSELEVTQKDLIFFNDKVVRGFSKSNDKQNRAMLKVSDSSKSNQYGKYYRVKLKSYGDIISKKFIKTSKDDSMTLYTTRKGSKFQPYDHKDPSNALFRTNLEQMMGNLKLDENGSPARQLPTLSFTDLPISHSSEDNNCSVPDPILFLNCRRTSIAHNQ